MKTKMDKVSLKTAKLIGKHIAERTFKRKGLYKYPNDKWIAISDNYDLNLWLEKPYIGENKKGDKMKYKATYQKTIWAEVLIEAKDFETAQDKAQDLDYIEGSFEILEDISGHYEDYILEDIQEEE